jgi:oligopeptide transport system ATP-binding protein
VAAGPFVLAEPGREPAAPTLLEVEHLRVNLRTRSGEVPVVRDLSFSIPASGKVALLGESGAGKSVTARTIASILDPRKFTTSGSVRIDGEEILGRSEKEMVKRRGSVALVFQDPTRTLNPSIRVGRQIAEGVRAAADVSKSEAQARAVQLMRDVGIADPEERFFSYPHQLSGGMRQRIVMAIALSMNPKLLLADEPTTSLDVTTQAQILDLISELVVNKQMALLLITHDVALAATSVEEMFVMYAGKLVERASSKQIVSAARMPYTKALISAVPGMQGSALPKAIPGRSPDLWSLPSGCAFHPRCSLAIERCATEEPPLVDVGDGRLCACWVTAPPR